MTFSTGVGVSFVSYAVDSKLDLLAGILNTVDFASSSTVTAVVALTGTRKFQLRPFEKKYLAAAGLIVLYGVVFSDAWRSNLFSQGLIGAGYIPLFANFVREQRNTESFSSWMLALCASLSGMGPALISGNTLAILYSSRSTLFCVVCLCVMTYFHFVHLRKQRA